MSRFSFMALAAAAILAFSALDASAGPNVPLRPELSKWVKANFKKGALPPFSFDYGGVPSSTFIRKWKFSTETDADGNAVARYRDPATGLEVICTIEVFPDFDAVEWTVRLHNGGAVDTPRISNFMVSDLQFVPGKRTDGFILNHLNGSLAAMDDFAPHYDLLEDGSSLSFSPGDGRSSSGAFPFFNIISDEEEDSGAVLSIGWSGSWKADFLCIGEPSQERLTVKAGIGRFNSYLKPGEDIRMPKISIMFWNGNAGEPNMVGNNKFRRFLLAHHSRKIDGKVAMYPLCGGLNWGDPAPLNEYSGMTTDYAKFLVDRYVSFDIKPDAIWLDAGWYKGAADWRNRKNWSNSVGTWVEDPERFPTSLKGVTDHIHRKGIKMMVWFEPERVTAGSLFHQEHPEWMLRKRGNEKTFLFNLADPDAREWLSSYMGGFLESRGIDYYRQDFNIEPEKYWMEADEPGREGMTEVLYIEGLYKFWDSLLERFPGLLIDNCASGGRRLDLETVGRSAPLWRSDYGFGEVNGYQNQTYGLEWFLPFHGTGVYTTDTYDSRSAYSSAMVMNFKLTDIRFSFFEMKRVYDEYRMLQPYYLEDFYPLSGTEDITSLSRWIVYQLHRPSDDTAFVLAFRRPESDDSTFTACLQGLDPAKKYTVRNMDTSEEVVLSGKDLSDGYVISLSEPRSCVLFKIVPTVI